MKKKTDLKWNNAELSHRAELRHRAELCLAQPHPAIATSDADARKLLHELQVHQIELELQNEELQQAKDVANTTLQQFSELYEFAPVGFFTLGQDACIRRVNLAGAGLLGSERSKLIGCHFGFFFEDDNRPAFAAFLDSVFSGTNKQIVDLVISCQSQTTRFVHIEAVVDAAGQYCHLAVTDLTERKRNEAALEIAASVHQAIGEAVMVADANNHIISINPAFTRITGYAPHEAIGKDTSLLKSGRQDKLFYQHMWQTLESTGHWQGEIWNRRKNGEIYPEWLSVYTIYDRAGCVLRRVALFSDITEQKRIEATIWQQANYDALTGLANRRLFRDRLEQDIKKAERSHLPVALLFIDLDKFKEINDTLGHDKGDILLIEAARRIIECVRESDTVARLGGDEFTVILPELDNMARIAMIAQDIIDKILLPFQLGEKSGDEAISGAAPNFQQVFISASIGITLYPDDGGTVDELIRHADQAMYVAKDAGRNCYSYYTSALQEDAVKRLHLIEDMRSALVDNQFRVYYQPIVELATGHIHKAEALIRWLHPKQGLVKPLEFIPLAEETGMIVEIGERVFMQAARQAKNWRRTHHPNFQISVNKSPVQFHDKTQKGNWPSYLQELMLPGESICVEITESLLLDQSVQVLDKLQCFRDAGIAVSLDDFGTGYSSLSYLKKFHIDYLKIDQSFVSNLENEVSGIALCEAIILMAHKLNIIVIAEGVETEFQRDILQAAGCDYVQGYLYSRPVPAEEFEHLLDKMAG